MSESLWQRLVRGCRRVRQRADWPAFAGQDWPDRIMTASVTDRFHAKQGRSTGRWILRADGRQLGVYLKRHYQLSRWRGLLALAWPDGGWSPALQEWRHLAWAQAQGLPVPRAVAAGEYIGPWGRLQSVLAVEELGGMLPVNEALPRAAAALEPRQFRRWKLELELEIARLVRELHSRRWFHKDLYLCHFYVAEDHTRMVPAWRGRVHLIDFHRLAHHPWTWPFWQIKDLAQLLYSSYLPEVDERDRAWLWRNYRDRRRHGLWEWAQRALARWKASRYLRHNLKRRRRRAEEEQNKG
jgi:heptose I phosphotransferase